VRKILYVLLALFLLIDVILVLTYFLPTSSVTSFLGLKPGNCKILIDIQCKLVSIKTDGTEVTAQAHIPQDTRIYSPADGTLSFYITPDDPSAKKGSARLLVHYLAGSNGLTYYFLFDPKTKPNGTREVKAGDVIGISTGKELQYLHQNSLSFTVKKNGQFAKLEFDSLFK